METAQQGDAGQLWFPFAVCSDKSGYCVGSDLKAGVHQIVYVSATPGDYEDGTN